VPNIIILGKGYVGTYLFSELSKNTDNHVTAISRKEVDYFDSIALKRYIRETQHIHHNDYEDIIILNCSGYTGRPNVDGCESNKELCLKYNTELPVSLSHFCKRNKFWLINVSSGCIFSGYEKNFTEDDIPNFGIYSTESSFYSKCKHLNEILCNKDVTTNLRIRMPFCGFNSDRNFLNKILNYSNLVSFDNSLTCLEDLLVFIEKFIKLEYYKILPGIYNVINPGSANAKQIVDLLSRNNLINPNWTFVDINSLSLKANRSNCVLSDNKIAELDLQLPPVFDSLEKCIGSLSEHNS